LAVHTLKRIEPDAEVVSAVYAELLKDGDEEVRKQLAVIVGILPKSNEQTASLRSPSE